MDTRSNTEEDEMDAENHKIFNNRSPAYTSCKEAQGRTRMFVAGMKIRELRPNEMWMGGGGNGDLTFLLLRSE